MITAPTESQPAITETQTPAWRWCLANSKQLLWRGWNWKAALLSSGIRAHIFLVVNLSAGWGPAWRAALAELAYRAVASGFMGALTQSFGRVNPPWAGAISAALVLPILSHSLEFVIHWLRGTPNLRASILASVCFTAVSTLFNWFAMRNGLLIVGRGQKSLWQDLRQLPILFWNLLRSAFAAGS